MYLLSHHIRNELENTIKTLASNGKGLLAADESTATISKRFSALGIPCTEETRRQYREMLMTTPEIQSYISGVILYEETLTQKTSTGVLFSTLLEDKGIVPGIKVDKGLVYLPGTREENTTQGLDGLSERLKEYKKQGARFAKWRSVYSITKDTPSEQLILTNAEVLARYAAECQAVGIVPIVEPEVLIEGEHTLETCALVSERVFNSVFAAIQRHSVMLELMLLKPSMVIPGKQCREQGNSEKTAEATLEILLRTVPAAVPSINFLSGGQTPEQATENLATMHRIAHQSPRQDQSHNHNHSNGHSQSQSHSYYRKSLPWNLSFSYSRALQEPSMKAWAGKSENMAAAQQVFYQRAKLNSLAALGQYERNLESA